MSAIESVGVAPAKPTTDRELLNLLTGAISTNQSAVLTNAPPLSRSAPTSPRDDDCRSSPRPAPLPRFCCAEPSRIGHTGPGKLAARGRLTGRPRCPAFSCLPARTAKRCSGEESRGRLMARWHPLASPFRVTSAQSSRPLWIRITGEPQTTKSAVVLRRRPLRRKRHAGRAMCRDPGWQGR